MIPVFNDPNSKKEELVACIKSKKDSEYWAAKFSPDELEELLDQFTDLEKDGMVSQHALFNFMGIRGTFLKK